MSGSEHFRSAYFSWLCLVRDRLEAMEYSAGDSEGIAQSRELARELWLLRRECELLLHSLHGQRLRGQLSREDEARATRFLHDAHWLLDISPSAPPALARQCLRIAQDRIAEEAQAEHGHLSEALAWRLQSSLAVA
jgi:hypothetical protein